jgi:hypothetical protein
MYVVRGINVPYLLQLTKMDYILQRNAADILEIGLRRKNLNFGIFVVN